MHVCIQANPTQTDRYKAVEYRVAFLSMIFGADGHIIIWTLAGEQEPPRIRWSMLFTGVESHIHVQIEFIVMTLIASPCIFNIMSMMHKCVCVANTQSILHALIVSISRWIDWQCSQWLGFGKSFPKNHLLLYSFILRY